MMNRKDRQSLVAESFRYSRKPMRIERSVWKIFPPKLSNGG